MREFVFNSEEEKEEFIGGYCPFEFDIPADCDDYRSCHSCWENNASLIVKGDK